MSTSAAKQKGAENGELSILDSIIAETRLTPDDEAYDIAKRGVSAFIEELLKPQNNGELIDRATETRCHSGALTPEQLKKVIGFYNGSGPLAAKYSSDAMALLEAAKSRRAWLYFYEK